MGLRQLKTPTTSRENTQQWWWVQYVYPASTSSPQTKTNQCLQTWSIKACPHLGEWSVHGGRWELEAIYSGFQRKPCLWSGGLGQCGQSVSFIVASRPCLGHGDYACCLGTWGQLSHSCLALEDMAGATTQRIPPQNWMNHTHCTTKSQLHRNNGLCHEPLEELGLCYEIWLWHSTRIRSHKQG